MPNLGDTTYIKHRLHMWVECERCKKQRWGALKTQNGKRTSPKLCASCFYKTYIPTEITRNKISLSTQGEKSNRWKGGRRMGNGYVEVWVDKNDFYYPMARRHYVKEHRLVIAKSLCRCLLSWEVVHHRNGDKTDNRLDNLVLVKSSEHLIDSVTKGALVKQRKRIVKLLNENQKLQTTILQLRAALIKGIEVTGESLSKEDFTEHDKTEAEFDEEANQIAIAEAGQ